MTVIDKAVGVLAKTDKVKAITHITKSQWFDIEECAKKYADGKGEVT